MKQLLPSFILFLFLYISNTNAQNSLTAANTQFVPNVFMPTPQQASLAKVSEIPVDITTGRIGFTIPIYEIKEKGLSLPISLSYNYSGLMVDEYAGWAGTGWIFNIGGSIIHSINGQDDETHQEGKTFVDAYLFNKPPFDGNHGEQPYMHNEASYLELLAAGIHDGLPDKYIVNIGNINCSFYLDKDDNPIFLKNEAYKIAFTSTRGFVLTDDKGIQYTFDKKITTDYHSPKNGDFGALAQYEYTSSYLITEIKFPDSTDKVAFEYTDSNILYQDNTLNQSLVLAYYAAMGTPFSNIYRNTTTVSTYNSYLKKITTAHETIEVSYNNSPSGLAVINNLKIKEKNNVIKNYDLNYSNWFDRRINLLSVSCNGQMINEMEYDMSKPYPNPTTLNDDYYLKKDLWGYYNAKYIPPTNTSYTPGNNNPKALEVINSPYNNPTVKPDYESTKIGALTKIIYPTKGYSLIDYEPNVAHMTRDNYNLPYDPDKAFSGGDEVKTTPSLDTDYIDKIITVSTKCKAVLSYYISLNTSIANYELSSGGTVKFYKEGVTSPIFIREQNWSNEFKWIPSVFYFTGSQPLDLEPGTYHLQSTSTKGTMARISLVTTTLPDEFDQPLGGLRIKQIKNCDFDGKCITDSYSYVDKNYCSGISLADLQFSSGSYYVSNMCNNNQETSYNYHNYNSVYPLSLYRGSSVLYGVVTKSTKDEQGNANGKEVLYSRTDYPVNANNPEESMLINGALIKKTISNQSNQKLDEATNTYEYSINPDAYKKLYGIKTSIRKDNFSSSGQGCIQIAHNHDSFSTTVLYHNNGNYKIKTETVSQHYKSDSLVTKTSYNYNLSSGFTTGKTQTTSKTSEILETKYFYPQDPEMLTKPFVNELREANIIGIPLDTEIYKAETKLSEQLTVYDKSTSTSNLLLPKTIYTGKFPNSLPTVLSDKNLERKITYDSYDDKGNILQYTPENGTPVSIIWGYNKTLPIAKVENATYDQISSYVASLQVASDEDSDNCISEDCKEQILRNRLNNLRTSLSQSMVTTYTYNPLVGVTSVTDQKGLCIYYEYDSLGRLKFIKDKDLYILEKYCYNYKGQQVDCSDNSSTTEFIYSSNSVSGYFTRNNCAAGGSPAGVTYTVPAGRYSSTDSQAAADSKAQTDVNTNGQAFANNDANAKCTFVNVAKSGYFTRNNCAAGGSPAGVTYTVPAGRYSSTDSQAAADSQAQTDVNTNGQAFANNDANAKCTFVNVAKSGYFTRNNCAAGGSPTGVTYTVPAGRYSSTDSQAAADSQAQTDVNNNGQAFANNDANAKCTFYNNAKSRAFRRYSCPSGGIGSLETYSVAAGIYSSTISQADADAIAQSVVDNNGQNYADSVGKCEFGNTVKSITVNKNNCVSGKYGSPVTYTIPAGTYNSFDSQADADNKAQNDLNSNYQNYANANGTCSSETYTVTMPDYDSNMKLIYISVSCNSAVHPARTISIKISYKWPSNTAWTINKEVVLPANVTNKGYQISLAFVGEPTILSYIVN